MPKEDPSRVENVETSRDEINDRKASAVSSKQASKMRWKIEMKK